MTGLSRAASVDHPADEGVVDRAFDRAAGPCPEEDAAAVLVILTALATARPEEPATVARSVWGRPPTMWPAGADAWWASGLPR